MSSAKVKPRQVPGFNIEDIPKDVADEIWPELSTNGGNCLCVQADSLFGEWVKKQGVKFPVWAWIVVWR